MIVSVEMLLKTVFKLRSFTVPLQKAVKPTSNHVQENLVPYPIESHILNGLNRIKKCQTVCDLCCSHCQKPKRFRSLDGGVNIALPCMCFGSLHVWIFACGSVWVTSLREVVPLSGDMGAEGKEGAGGKGEGTVSYRWRRSDR